MTDATPRPTILVVDDEPGVRVMVARMLTLSGYSVVSAQSGEEAITIAQEYAAPIDLVLTDVRMPVMSGPEMVTELQKLRPEIRVMYMSAYSRDVLPPGVQDPTSPSPKPFTMRTRRCRSWRPSPFLSDQFNVARRAPRSASCQPRARQADSSSCSRAAGR